MLYSFTKRYNPDEELLDLSGKVALVTGGSSGLGYWTVQYLVRRGAKVYMGARSEKKATDAIHQLQKEGLGSMGGSVIWLHCDLSHPRLAKQSAETLMAREERLDILINNAAQMPGPFKILEDGIADIVLVNLLTLSALVDCLLPIMEKTAALPNSDVRIVNVGSESHRRLGKVDSFSGKESLNRKFSTGIGGEIDQYAFTKLGVVLYTAQLQKELDQKNIPITAIVADPGIAPTEGNASIFNRMPFGTVVTFIFRVMALKPHEGAMTSVYAAASKTIAADRKKYGGQMIEPFGKLSKPSVDGQNIRLAEELWETRKIVMQEIWENDKRRPALPPANNSIVESMPAPKKPARQPMQDAMRHNPVM